MKTDTRASVGPQDFLDPVNELTALIEYFQSKKTKAVVAMLVRARTEIEMLRNLVAFRSGDQYQQAVQELCTMMYADGMKLAAEGKPPPRIKYIQVVYDTEPKPTEVVSHTTND